MKFPELPVLNPNPLDTIHMRQVILVNCVSWMVLESIQSMFAFSNWELLLSQPSFLQRCLRYKIQARRKQRYEFSYLLVCVQRKGSRILTILALFAFMLKLLIFWVLILILEIFTVKLLMLKLSISTGWLKCIFLHCRLSITKLLLLP